MNSVEVGEEFLAHYGVKGMHWGIRKSEDHSTVPSDVAEGIKKARGEHQIYTKKKLHVSRSGQVRPYNPAIVGSAVLGAGIVGSILTTAVFPMGGAVSAVAGGAIGSTVAASIIRSMGNRKIYQISDSRTQWVQRNNP